MKSIIKKIIRKVFGDLFFVRLQEYKNKISNDRSVYLILLEKQKAIYFFIPKVACSSIKKACADILGMNTSDIDKQGFPHPKISELNKYKDYFKFAFVRNPWDRLVSCYRNRILNTLVTDEEYFKGVSNGFVRFKKFYAGMPFDEFVEAVFTISDDDADQHFRSQYIFITDKEKRLLVDYVGRFENLENDFSHVLKIIHAGDHSLNHLNKTNRTNYREYYNERTEKMVAQRYADDISLFNYKF